MEVVEQEHVEASSGPRFITVSYTIDSAIDSFGIRPIDPKFFIGDKRLMLTQDDYRLRAFRKDGEMSPPNNVFFRDDLTPYAIILQALDHKIQMDDVALLGFDVCYNMVNCLQVQGGKGRFRELSPLSWDRLLLSQLVDISREASFGAVTMVPIHEVNGFNEDNAERLLNRYDLNAVSQGFRYSKELDRYVLELR